MRGGAVLDTQCMEDLLRGFAAIDWQRQRNEAAFADVEFGMHCRRQGIHSQNVSSFPRRRCCLSRARAIISAGIFFTRMQ
jgi:hypothetical protein